MLKPVITHSFLSLRYMFPSTVKLSGFFRWRFSNQLQNQGDGLPQQLEKASLEICDMAFRFSATVVDGCLFAYAVETNRPIRTHRWNFRFIALHLLSCAELKQDARHCEPDRN